MKSPLHRESHTCACAPNLVSFLQNDIRVCVRACMSNLVSFLQNVTRVFTCVILLVFCRMHQRLKQSQIGLQDGDACEANLSKSGNKRQSLDWQNGSVVEEIERAVSDWIARHPNLTVKTMLPIVAHGATVSVHIWWTD